jgi:hypothetical protein
MVHMLNLASSNAKYAWDDNGSERKNGGSKLGNSGRLGGEDMTVPLRVSPAGLVTKSSARSDQAAHRLLGLLRLLRFSARQPVPKRRLDLE